MSTCPYSIGADGFTPTDEGLIVDPYPTYEQLRINDPIHKSNAHGGFYFVSRYDDVRDVARRVDDFTTTGGVTIPSNGSTIPLLPLETDPPIHTQYRRQMQPWFSQTEVAKWTERIRDIVNELIDGFVDKRTVELASEFILAIPAITIAMVLGLDREDWHYFQDLGARWLLAAAEGRYEDNAEMGEEMIAYLSAKLDERRTTPRDDMLTSLTKLVIDGEHLSYDYAAGMAFFLLQAGHETTVAALGSMFMLVAKDDELQKRLAADPSLIASTVEEVLRYEPPVQYLARTATRDVVLNGVALHEGDRLLLGWGSACRDRDAFVDADEFVYDRPRNSHVAFGSGIHRCLGAALAKLEMTVALEEALKRMPNFRLAPDDEVVIGGVFSRGPRHLKIVW